MIKHYYAKLHQRFGRHRKLISIRSKPTIKLTKDMIWCTFFEAEQYGNDIYEFQFNINNDSVMNANKYKLHLFRTKKKILEIQLDKLFDWYFGTGKCKYIDLDIRLDITTDSEEDIQILLNDILPDNIGLNKGILTLPAMGVNIAQDIHRKTVVSNAYVNVTFNSIKFTKNMHKDGYTSICNLIGG